MSKLATDFIEFEKIVSSKCFRRKVSIIMVELRKILIQMMDVHMTPLGPILLVWLFTSHSTIRLSESDEEVFDEARLPNLLVPKNQDPLVFFHVYNFIISIINDAS
jgi:hypothetical protein